MGNGLESLARKAGRGTVSRRQFLRIGAGLVGSIAGGTVIGACAPAAAPKPETGGQPAATSAPSTSKQVIKIGAPHPLTGPWAEVGNNSVHGITCAITDINGAGGIKSMGGATLELVPGDTQNDPALAASVTKRLIESDKVTALIGCYLSSYTLPASTEAEKAGIPMLSQSFSNELTSRGYKYFFQLPPTSTVNGTAAVKYIREALDAAKVDITKAACISSNDASSKAQADACVDQAKGAGFDMAYYELFASGLTDATPIATKIRDSGAEILFLTGATPDLILVIKTLRGLGWTHGAVGIGGGGMLTRGLGESLGEASAGVFGIAAWNDDLPYPGVKEYSERFNAMFNEPFMPQESGECYVATWEIANALEAVGVADPAKIRDYLSATTFDSGPAATMPGGVVDFDDTGLNTKTFPLLVEWQGGRLNTVWPEEVRQMEAVF